MMRNIVYLNNSGRMIHMLHSISNLSFPSLNQKLNFNSLCPQNLD